MSRFLLYTDVHFSEFSSIIRSQGKNYSTRLEYLINSLNWAENQAELNNCDEVICLGDFFDKPDLNSRELTALREIKWCKLPHIFIVGNHEASVKSLKYNSVTALQNNGFEIIDKPTIKYGFGYEILLLPYITEDERKELSYYWNRCREHVFITQEVKRPIILSHNDIKGIQYGVFESKEGFDVSDIEKSCDLFLNGHLHNGSKFCRNGINLGNLTGQNFSEDAFKYDHSVFILNTQKNTLESIENPYAFNFYKIDCTGNNFNDLYKIKNNSILSIKCDESSKNKLDEVLKELSDKILERRVTLVRDAINVNVSIDELKKEDHLVEFVNFCKERIDNTEILNVELSEVCK